MTNQTIKDYEIIIVDDGSTDKSSLIIKEYADNYPGLINSYYKKNGGLGSARNFGISFAKGEYIGFIDSDDYVKADMFELMYDKAKNENADIVICDFNIVDDYDKILYTTAIDSFTDVDIGNKLYAYKYGRTEAVNKIYRKELFTESNIRYPAGWFEDIPVTMMMIEKANKIAYVNRPLVNYVRRQGSIMNQASAGGFSENNCNIFNVCKIIIDNKNHFSDEGYNILISEVIPVHTFLRFYLPILSVKNRKERNRLIKEWGEKLNELIPEWYKSAPVKRIMEKADYFKRIFFMAIIKSFRYNLTIHLNVLLFIGGSYFVKKLREKNNN